MSQQLGLDPVVVLLPSAFAGRWKELERMHRTSVVITDVLVTSMTIVATIAGEERAGGRSAGDAAAADQVWAAAHRRPR